VGTTTNPGVSPDARPVALARLLVVDDDPDVRQMLVRFLVGEGYDVTEAASSTEAAAGLRAHPIDLVILDVMLTAESGLDLLSVLRRTSHVPVILLTARGQEIDRVLGLKLGADDYVVKPFSPAELAARVETVLRRTGRGADPFNGSTTPVPPSPSGLSPRTLAESVAGPGPEVARHLEPEPTAPEREVVSRDHLDFGDLVIDLAARDVWVRGVLVPMTAREFDLLAFLAGSPRQVFSREQLLAQVWASSSDWQDADTVTEHVRRVRRKVDERSGTASRIRTVRGVGYRFEP
jgi:two-component system, OmpR family, phosphate regulon response regulator PhoB